MVIMVLIGLVAKRVGHARGGLGFAVSSLPSYLYQLSTPIHHQQKVFYRTPRRKYDQPSCETMLFPLFTETT
jgi:hypothetical protein